MAIHLPLISITPHMPTLRGLLIWWVIPDQRRFNGQRYWYDGFSIVTPFGGLSLMRGWYRRLRSLQDLRGAAELRHIDKMLAAAGF